LYNLRKGELDKARKTFGQAIGKCPKPSIFKAYAQFEMQLVEIDRCRKIYEKQL
jgi:crooked neck